MDYCLRPTLSLFIILAIRSFSVCLYFFYGRRGTVALKFIRCYVVC